MFIVLDPPNRREPQSIDFYGTVLHFDFHEVDGVRKLAARIPDTASRLADIRRLVNRRTNMKIVKDVEVTPISEDRRSPVGSPGAPESPVAGLTTAALTKGWLFADLVGTGNDDNPGEEGGRSPRTGLTLAEMGLLPPPADWDAQAKSCWPWQCQGFAALPGWMHPDLANKVDPNADEAPIDGEDSAPYLSDDAPGDEVEPSTGSEEPVDEEPVDNADHGIDPAVAAGYEAEHVEAARRLAHEAAAKRGTADYHPNALNYFLRKAELPTVNQDQLDGLLAIAPN